MRPDRLAKLDAEIAALSAKIEHDLDDLDAAIAASLAFARSITNVQNAGAA